MWILVRLHLVHDSHDSHKEQHNCQVHPTHNFTNGPFVSSLNVMIELAIFEHYYCTLKNQELDIIVAILFK